MALDLDQIRESVDNFRQCAPEAQATYTAAAESVMWQMRQDLAALNDLDLAAVAFYISRLMSVIRHRPLKDAGDVVTDTGVAYALITGKLLGMLD